jgi:hypothetical protein
MEVCERKGTHSSTGRGHAAFQSLLIAIAGQQLAGYPEFGFAAFAHSDFYICS